MLYNLLFYFHILLSLHTSGNRTNAQMCVDPFQIVFRQGAYLFMELSTNCLKAIRAISDFSGTFIVEKTEFQDEPDYSR